MSIPLRQSGERRRYLAYDPDFAPEDAAMRFRLTYEGQLFGASRSSTRAKHKHEIRKVFHPQLKRLWETDKNLTHWTFTDPAPSASGLKVGPVPIWKQFAKNYRRDSYAFVPLVTEEFSLVAGVDILFLRPESPGGVIQSGDIDNRLKTLFDALRMPSGKSEFGGYDEPDEGESPFFVLLEDDKLISHVSIETDSLLEPTLKGEERFSSHDCRLVITVSVTPTFRNIHNLHIA